MTDDYTVQYKALNNSKIFTIVFSSISLLFPLSVVIILIQRYNKLVRDKSLTQYIMMIAIADTMTILFYTFGYPLSGSVVCSIQGFCLLFFSRMSWFYTDVLIFQLFYIILFKKYFLDKRYMHLIVFTLNIILSLLPLSTGTGYGQDDDDKGIPVGVCGFSRGKSDDDEVRNQWYLYVFNIELYISFIFVSILSTIVAVYSLTVDNKKTSDVFINEKVKDTWKVMILYPLAMIVSWLPSIAYGHYYDSYQNHYGKYPRDGILIHDYLQAVNNLYGPLLAIIFYTSTVNARKAWIQNVKCILNLVMDIDIDINDRSSCSSIISIEDGAKVSEFSLSKSFRSSVPPPISETDDCNVNPLSTSFRSSAPPATSETDDYEVNPLSTISNELITRIELE